MGRPRLGEAMPAGEQHRVFGPDAGIDDADDHVAASGGRTAERRPDGRRADERRVVVERVLERVLLDRDDTIRLEQGADLVGREPGRDATKGAGTKSIFRPGRPSGRGR